MIVVKLPVFLVLLFTSLCLQAQAGPQLLESFLQKTHSLQANFNQTLHDDRGFLLQESSGQFSLQRPGRFLWDYETPYEQKIISNGTKVWVYDAELEQVSVKRYDQVLSGAPVLLLDKQNTINEDFKLVDLGQKGRLHWIQLDPVAAENDFQLIRVAMVGKQLHSMKLLDNFNQTTTLVFSDLKTNLNLPRDMFEFIPPSGTDIVGDF